jgi:glucose-1-phosphate thymidylyltransferase
MQCAILCAGFATRLYPLTETVPKHLLPVAGRPVLDYVVERLAAVGIDRGVLVTNRTFADQFSRWAANQPLAANLKLLDDGATSNEGRLGSIGDLQFALTEGDIQEDFLVVNGDNLFTFGLEGVLETFRRRGNTIALYDVGSESETSKMGVADCDSTDRVVGFREKPPVPGTTVASIGIYVYRAEVRALVAQYLSEGHSPDKTGSFVEWLHQQAPIFGHRIQAEDGLWFDIGSHEQYAEANHALERLQRGGESAQELLS